MPGHSVDFFASQLGDPDTLATEIASMWDNWKSHKSQRELIKAEVIQYLHAIDTKGTENDTNNHNHTTHRPKLTQIYDNLMANYMQGLIPSDSFFAFEGDDDKSVDEKIKLNIEAYIRTKHRQMPGQGKFRGRIKELLADWLMGDCIARVSFIEKSHEDPTTKEELPGYQGPVVYRINPNDIVFNPLAVSFKQSPKIIRSVKTLGELARDIEEHPEFRYQQETFEQILADRNTAKEAKEKDINEAVQLQYDGFGSYAEYIKGNEVEILEFYGDIYDTDNNKLLKNYCITVFDRRYIARQEPTDTYDGYPTIFKAGYRKLYNNLYSMGALENLLGMQYYINHLENAKADAFDDMLLPDRVISGFIEEEEGEKGEITYYVDANGDVKNLSPDAQVLHADFKIRETEQNMELYAGAPSEGVGIRSPGEKTKFEVATLEGNRGRFFQHNMSSFEEDILEDIINAEIELARKYIGGNRDSVKLEDSQTGAKTFKEIGKSDISGNGKLIPIGARHHARMAQLAQNLMQFEQAVLGADRELAQHFPTLKLAKLWERILEFERFDLIEPYGRIPEQLEAQRRLSAANRTLQEENKVDIAEGEDMEDTEGVEDVEA